MIAEQLLSLFHGRDDYIAVGNGDGFAPQQIEPPIKPGWLRKEHLAGKRCLGFYLMTAASQVFCSAVDFDNKPDAPDPEWQDKAAAVYYELVGMGLTPLVEISQSGHAAHVWLFFEEATDAWLVRAFWRAIEEQLPFNFCEVYPRQDDLVDKKIGNLIRFPLWNESKFVDPENEWATLDAVEALGSVKKTDAATLRMLCYQLTGSTPAKPERGVSSSGLSVRVDRLISRSNTLLSRRWHGDMEGLNDRSRSALVLSLATELVRLYVPTPEIEQALTLWCAQNDYEKGERADWVSTTVAKAYEFIGGRKAEKHSTALTVRDAVEGYIEKLRQGIPPCFGSGIREVDDSVDGVAPGEVCIIAARPSHGKTAFAMNWVDNVAYDQTPCLIISEEMAAMELGKRALLAISQIPEDRWPESMDRIKADVAEHYEKRANIHLVESCQTIDEVERQVDEHCSLYGVKFVAVDYLQLLGSDHASRYESVTEISRRLKQTATRNGVAMLVLSQLNREVEKRDGFEPRLSDLRESGQIEQDADLILMLQWPIKHDMTADAETYKVFCGKRRNGPTRESVVFTTFDAERQQFGKPVAAAWQP